MIFLFLRAKWIKYLEAESLSKIDLGALKKLVLEINHFGFLDSPQI